MATIYEALTIVSQHLQAGRLTAAEQILRQVLQINPNEASAWHMLGGVASRAGQPEQAAGHFARAITLQGDHADFHNSLGAAYFLLRRFVEAAACYRQALELKPDYAEVHSNLGDALKELGSLDEAIVCYRRCLELKPGYAEAHNSLGNAFKQLNQLEEAAACFRRAVELKPGFAEAHNNLGITFKDQGRWDEAIASTRRALALKPGFAEAHNNLGCAFTDQGKFDDAVASFRRALELKPDFAPIHTNLGIALKGLGDLDGAMACHRSALELDPDYTEARIRLGNTLKAQGKLDEAIACFRQVLARTPGSADAYLNLGSALKDLGKLEDALASFRRAVDLKPEFASAFSNLIYTYVFCPGFDAPRLFEEHRSFHQRYAAPLADGIEPHGNDRTPGRRLRIGYVSPDFRDHVVGLNLLPLLREHDRRQFEIFCYADEYRRDDVTNRFRSYADGWCNITSLSEAQLASRIREDRIDILVDLTLHMARNRLLAFARKPAPVQVTFAGYPGTTGLEAIDYRLTDPYLDPPDLFDRFYSEESIRLPDTFWCYDPLDIQPTPNDLPAVKNSFITFGCLNNFCKVNDAVLKLWARVLRREANSRLLLLAAEGSHRRETLDQLAREGVASDRVTFFAPLTREKYLALYHRIDIALDTFPYNGHTTSLDAFWMGVPVVTRVGSTVVGRAGLSQLTNLGLPELIAESEELYVQIAAELASDRPRLTALRATLREKMQASPLMDAPRFARGIEAAYREMWRRWCSK